MVPVLIYHLPEFLIIVLSGWLGLSLLVRSPFSWTVRIFAWLCVVMVFYSISALQAQLTVSQTVLHFLHREHLAAAVLAPAAFLHFIVVLSHPGRIRTLHTILITLCYTTGTALAAYAAFGPLAELHPPYPPWTTWGEPRFPPGTITWAAIIQQTVPVVLALVLMWSAYRRTPLETQEGQQRKFLRAAALLAGIGAIEATIAREIVVSPLLPRAMIGAALLVLTYTVLTHRAMIPSRLAQRSLIYTLLGSLLTVCYVFAAIFLEWISGKLLEINIPLVTIISILGMAIAFGPVGEWMRSQIDRPFYPREFDYRRLLKSLSDELFERGGLNDQLQAALSLICRALDVHDGLVMVASQEGMITRAIYGDSSPPPHMGDIRLPDEAQEMTEPWEPWPPAQILFPIRRGNEHLGVLALGKRGDDHPDSLFTSIERALLNHLSSYMALTIAHAHTRDEHQAVMVTLSEQGKMLRQQQEQLSLQAAEAVRQVEEMTSRGNLRVHALGSLLVERDGETITRWGGDKAGTYQAEALFAFLFDRRGKGITKDEAKEIIWPDLEIAKADSAFHRTLAALRRTLEPGLHRGNQSKAILYHHDRYWLEPGIIAWCDTETFIAATERGINLFHQNDHKAALNALETASQLYRGDYMDDCPFFGDSSYVEDTRNSLRSRVVEVHLALGSIYESLGRAGDAATAYRQAVALSFEDCPPARDGLARLQEGLAG